MLVRLREPPRPHPRAEPGPAGVRHARYDDVAHRTVLRVRITASRSEQTQEMRLAGAVRAEHRDALAVPDLEVEGLHEAGELEVLYDDRPLARTATAQA